MHKCLFGLGQLLLIGASAHCLPMQGELYKILSIEVFRQLRPYTGGVEILLVKALRQPNDRDNFKFYLWSPQADLFSIGTYIL